VAESLVAASALAALVWSWQADRDWFELHVGDHFCVFEPSQPERWKLWRIGGALVGVLLLVVVRPLLGRWVERVGGRQALGWLASTMGAAILALLVSDRLLRTKGPVYPLLPPIREDARYGWSYPAHTTVTIPVDGRDVVYAFNDRGDRARTMDDRPDPARPTILIAGESTADGIGVPWEESFAGLLEQRLGLQIVDSAVHGWDAGRAYVRAMDELRDFSHVRAVVTLFVAQQLDRAESVTHPRFVLSQDGSLVERPAAPTWWIDSPVRKLVREVLHLHGEAPVAVTRAVFEATARSARAQGAYPLFVLTNWGPPCLPDASGAPPIERTLFEGLAVPHIRVDLDPAWENAATHHTDARGHVRLANAIERALREANALAPE
jgi:hypothetical protein